MSNIVWNIILSCANLLLGSILLTLTIDFVLSLFSNSFKSSVWRFIYDVIFIVFHILLYIMFIYYFNSGKPRWYYFLFDVYGIIVYYRFLVKLIHKITTYINRLFEIIIFSIIKIIKKLIIFSQTIAKNK